MMTCSIIKRIEQALASVDGAQDFLAGAAIEDTPQDVSDRMARAVSALDDLEDCLANWYQRERFPRLKEWQERNA